MLPISTKNTMRLSLICFALLCNTALFAQSKKELKAQVNALKTEIEQLKKPKQVDFNNAHKKASYGLGVLMATNVKKQGGDSLDVETMTIAMQDVFLSKTLKMNEQECMTIVQPYMQKAMERKSNAAKEDGIAFLEANKTKEGVKVTTSGLQYKVLVTGTGKAPGSNDNVSVHYTGKLIDGTVFDSSVTKEKPASFGVSNVIPGWTEALQLMHEGDKWMVYIPYQLAYGERGAGGQIPPFAALVFEMELIKVN